MTTMQKAAAAKDGSVFDHLDRRITAVKVEMLGVANSLATQRTPGRPGPKPAVAKVRQAIRLMDEANAALRAAEPAIRRAIR